VSDFNAQSARAKRPCPLWVDAFQRDTQHLQADEVGAYMLILMAMWTRESCDFPDDDSRLARISRVSTRLWKSRIGPVLREFFKAENGALFSKRLREEATYVERVVTEQSNRKKGKKTSKPLENNDQEQSADTSMDTPTEYPTQQPNNPREEDKSSSTQEAADYLIFLEAHPKPVESKKGESAFSELISSGVDPKQIIAAAAGYAETVASWSSEAKVQQSDNFIDPERGKWREFIPKPKATRATEAERMKFWADAVNAGRFVAPSSINPDMARSMVAAGLVTPEKLKERGIAA
jgi:uncharacterized protein YdaU (DUF1376 family)